MADSSLNDLNYGRPGLTAYDIDNHEWAVSRQPTAKKLTQVADWQLSVPASKEFTSTKTSTNATTARKNAKQLTYSFPQLVPGAKWLPELNMVSEAITSATATYDPRVGDLLSFGTIFLKKFVRPKQIVALPVGPSGNILRLVILGQQHQGWSRDRSVWLSGPSFEGADSGYWNEEAAPIQQVCFGQTETSNSFLAVRLLSKTVLFRPSYHRGRQAAEPSTYYDLPPSLVSANPIFSITLNQTDGVPHADVSFNPDYQFQFGIVNQHYNWSLWQIERRAKREEYSVSRMIGGYVLPDTNIDMDDGDGWARILWAGDSSTLIVCNRRHLSLINISGDSFDYLQMPLIVPPRSLDWILDIKRHPRHQNRFFILTSTRLFVIAVITVNAAVDSANGQAGATILSSRRHYRGDEDVTLQLSVQSLVNEEICVFLHSSLNEFIQVYYLQNYSSESSNLIVSSDPLVLDLVSLPAAYVKHIHLQLLDYGTRVQMPSNWVAQSYLERAVPFYQLTLVSVDLNVHQTILLSSEHDHDPEPITWRKTVIPNHSLETSGLTDEMEDSIVPNGPDWNTGPESKLKHQALRLASPLDRPSTHGTRNYMAVYETVLHSSQTEAMSMERVIKQLREQMTTERNTTDQRFGNILEVFDSVDVPDIDDASAKVDELFADDLTRSGHLLRHIGPAHVLRFPETENPSIANLYDTILQDWIAPLPAEIPVPVRQVKERLARRIATEVTLASSRLRSDEGERHGADSGDSMSLPILPSKPANVLPSSLPTPPQSSVPPSSPSLPESLQPPISDPLSRLRKHLEIDDESMMTPTIISKNVSELLSHWQPGTNPSTYNWEATEHALRPETPDEASQEQREKERKKKERREKRQRHEDELMRAKSQTSSQPAFAQPAFPRSSPGPTFGGMAASSQVPMPTSSQVAGQGQSQGGGFGGFGGVNSIMPQSQVEPGRFGGRPEKKKKKGKSRVSGF